MTARVAAVVVALLVPGLAGCAPHDSAARSVELSRCAAYYAEREPGLSAQQARALCSQAAQRAPRWFTAEFGGAS